MAPECWHHGVAGCLMFSAIYDPCVSAATQVVGAVISLNVDLSRLLETLPHCG